MRAYKVGGLPVVDEAGRLIGVITVADVLDAFVSLSGVGEATHRLVLTARSSAQMATRARRAIEQVRGEIYWLRRDPSPRPQQLHVRVKVKRIDTLVAALEAEGVRVVRVVAAARA
jgi:acetoin utilization protein AcuB